MKTILYGNDIHLEWGFTDAVTGLNFDFAGVDIKLTLFSCNKVLLVDNYTQEGGTINAIIPTKCMPCGVYTAECEYSVGMGVKRAKVRINDAFQISNNKPWHPEEGITPCEMHEMETVYLHSIAMPIITSKIAMIEYLSGNRYNELKENDCLKKRTIYVVEKEGEKADMYLYKYPLSSGSIPGTIDWDDIQNKPDIPESYVLPIAKENELGGIKASPKTENETTEVKIGEDGKLYAPEISKIRMATENELGGIKASPKTDCDTVEIKIGEDGKLYGEKGVGGNPDNEDLCLSTNSDGKKVLKFNNKSYDASSFSGLGRVYLRKNIVSDKNKLIQDMINSPNTIYIIQYDYDLAGGTINIPSNCVLDFQGGTFKNGVFVGDDTIIMAGPENIFGDVILNGTWTVNSAKPEWFGAKGDNTTDDTAAFQAMLDSGFCTIELTTQKKYNITSISAKPNGKFILNGNNAEIYVTTEEDGSVGITIDCNWMLLKDFYLKGPGMNIEGKVSGLKLGSSTSGGNYILVDNLHIQNFSEKGIWTFDTMQSEFTNSTIQYCNIGLYDGPVLWDIITTTTFSNLYVGGNNVGIHASRAYYCTFDRIIAEWNKTGIYIFGSNVTVRCPYFEQNYDYGMHTEDVEYLLLGPVKIHGAGDGIKDDYNEWVGQNARRRTELSNWGMSTTELGLVDTWASGSLVNRKLKLSADSNGNYLGVECEDGFIMFAPGSAFNRISTVSVVDGSIHKSNNTDITVEKVSTGVYDIRFTSKICPAFYVSTYHSGAKIVTKILEEYGGQWSNYKAFNGVRVSIFDESGQVDDNDFCFTLIDQQRL